MQRKIILHRLLVRKLFSYVNIHEKLSMWFIFLIDIHKDM